MCAFLPMRFIKVNKRYKSSKKPSEHENKEDKKKRLWQPVTGSKGGDEAAAHPVQPAAVSHSNGLNPKSAEPCWDGGEAERWGGCRSDGSTSAETLPEQIGTICCWQHPSKTYLGTQSKEQSIEANKQARINPPRPQNISAGRSELDYR